ncbi:unnamed protein product [Owenia fusiformis]|uniref:UBA domain-containing protein n=1 Tax=Owenia fusiformis TaxID=6347 RepID=A0A8S4PTX7_OWEFU|nr:unnamed protein product [Owenia fusiformis]
MSTASNMRAGKGGKDKTKTHTHNKTDIKQATAEQMRQAQLSQGNLDKMETDDPQLQKKVKEVMEMTGKGMDDVILALHDCDQDANRAVLQLLEENSQGEWKTTTKKKKAPAQKTVEQNHKARDLSPDIENRDFSNNRDRENNRPRRGRGMVQNIPRLSRGRGGNNSSWKNKENEENDMNRSDSRDNRGRGRGRGRGSGRGRGGRYERPARFDRQNDNGNNDMGVFNSDNNVFNVNDTAGGGETSFGTWSNDVAMSTEKKTNGNSTWKEQEDWAADEWQGDLKESQVFTASATTPSNNAPSPFNTLDAPTNNSAMHDATLGQRLDLGSLLSQPSNVLPDRSSKTSEQGSSLFQQPKPQDSNQSLFQQPVSKPQETSNLFPTTQTPKTQSNSLFQSSQSLQDPKDDNDPIASLLQQTRSLTDGSGKPPNIDAQQQFMSAFAKQATETIKNAVGIGGTTTQSSSLPGNTSSLNTSSLGNFSQSSLPVSQPRPTQSISQSQASLQNLQKQGQPRIKYPPSKIPASAVEMPGHLPIGGISDVQFGVDFGNEAPSFGFGGETPTKNNYSKTTTVETPESSIGGLDTMGTDSAPGVFQKPVTTTPPGSKTDFTPPGLQQNKIGPEPIPFPTSQDRNSMPLLSSQRNSQNTGSLNTSSPSSQLPYTQAGFSSGGSYQNNSYQSHKSSAFTSSPTYPTNATNQSTGQSQYGNYQTGTAFQNSTSLYQNNSNESSSLSGNFPASQSTYQSPSAGGSSGTSSGFQSSTGSYPNETRPYSGGSSQSYQGQNSSYQTQSQTNSYQNQSAAPGFQTQPANSSYHSRDSNSYSPGVSQSSYQATVTQSNSYQRDSQSTSLTHQSDSQGVTTPTGNTRDITRDSTQSYGNSYPNTHNQTLPDTNKLSENLSKASLSDTNLESTQQQGTMDLNSTSPATSLTTTTNSTTNSLSTSSVNVSSVLASITSSSSTLASSSTINTTKATTSTTQSSKPHTLPPGVIPPSVLPGNYPIMGQPTAAGLQPYFNLAAGGQQQMYSYEDIQAQLLQQRLHLPGYYDIGLQAQNAGGVSRDQNSLPNAASNPAYATTTGATDGSKLTPRLDAQSPPQAQTSQPQQSQTATHTGYVNPAAALPPGYGYYYPGTTGAVIPGFYNHMNMIVPPVTNVTNTVGQAVSNSLPYQKPYAASGTQVYAAGGNMGGYDVNDVTAQSSHDYKNAYGTQAPSKATTGPFGSSSEPDRNKQLFLNSQTIQYKSPAATSSGVNVTDLTATGYAKSHTGTYDKPGFAGNTPPPFNTNMAALPTGNQSHLGTLPATYPFVPMMPQQLQHLQQDSSGAAGRVNPQAPSTAKPAVSKQYGNTYWGTS